MNEKKEKKDLISLLYIILNLIQYGFYYDFVYVGRENGILYSGKYNHHDNNINIIRVIY